MIFLPREESLTVFKLPVNNPLFCDWLQVCCSLFSSVLGDTMTRFTVAAGVATVAALAAGAAFVVTPARPPSAPTVLGSENV